MAALLLEYHEEAVAEAARAFGNFARSGAHRGAMREARAHEALCLLLDHRDWEVVHAAAGALINAAAEPECAAELAAAGALGALLALMERCVLSELHDTQLVALELACKAAANLLAAAGGPGGALSGAADVEDAATLAALLRHAQGVEALADDPGLQALFAALLPMLPDAPAAAAADGAAA